MLLDLSDSAQDGLKLPREMASLSVRGNSSTRGGDSSSSRVPSSRQLVPGTPQAIILEEPIPPLNKIAPGQDASTSLQSSTSRSLDNVAIIDLSLNPQGGKELEPHPLDTSSLHLHAQKTLERSAQAGAGAGGGEAAVPALDAIDPQAYQAVEGTMGASSNATLVIVPTDDALPSHQHGDHVHGSISGNEEVIVGRSGGDDSAVGASSVSQDRSIEPRIQEILLALGASCSREARTLSGEAGAAVSGDSSRRDHVEIWNYIYWAMRSYEIGVLGVVPELIAEAKAKTEPAASNSSAAAVRSLLTEAMKGFNESVELACIRRKGTGCDTVAMMELLRVLNKMILGALHTKLGGAPLTSATVHSVDGELRDRADATYSKLVADVEEAMRPCSSASRGLAGGAQPSPYSGLESNALVSSSPALQGGFGTQPSVPVGLQGSVATAVAGNGRVLPERSSGVQEHTHGGSLSEKATKAMKATVSSSYAGDNTFAGGGSIGFVTGTPTLLGGDVAVGLGAPIALPAGYFGGGVDGSYHQRSQQPPPQRPPPVQAHRLSHPSYPMLSSTPSAPGECVMCCLSIFQASVLEDIPTLFVKCLAKDGRQACTSATGIYDTVVEKLKLAMKVMEKTLMEVLHGGGGQEYRPAKFSKLLDVQIKVIHHELAASMGFNLPSMSPELRLEWELKKRAKAAHLVIKAKMDKARLLSNGTSSRARGKAVRSPRLSPPAQTPGPLTLSALALSLGVDGQPSASTGFPGPVTAADPSGEVPVPGRMSGEVHERVSRGGNSKQVVAPSTNSNKDEAAAMGASYTSRQGLEKEIADALGLRWIHAKGKGPAPVVSGSSMPCGSSQQQPQQTLSMQRNRFPHESPSQTAVWNCVFYNIKVYQTSILQDLPGSIAAAYAKINPRINIGGAPAIQAQLEVAIKRFNTWVMELRKERKKMAYDMVIMSKLLQTQNKIIVDELTMKLGLNLPSLASVLNMDWELKKRAEAAHLAVKAKVDMAKRAEIMRVGAATGSSSLGSGSVVGAPGAHASASNGSVTPTGTAGTVSISKTPSATSGGVAVKVDLEYKHSQTKAHAHASVSNGSIAPTGTAGTVSISKTPLTASGGVAVENELDYKRSQTEVKGSRGQQKELLETASEVDEVVVEEEETEARTGKSRCLDAFLVALHKDHAEGSWYVSMRELQLVSLQFCIACRSLPTLRVRVDGYAPNTLWVPPRVEVEPKRKKRHVSRVPGVKAKTLRWDLPFDFHRISSTTLLDSVETVAFGDGIHDRAAISGWPSTLQNMVLSQDMNECIDKVDLPQSLLCLTFGARFDQPVCQVSWPRRLRELTFGDDYNRDVAMVVWPSTLRKLVFGRTFNQPMNNVVLPVSLLELAFGSDFNQPIQDVAWPKVLEVLSFGKRFNQVIRGVAWPTTLRELRFSEKDNDVRTWGCTSLLRAGLDQDLRGSSMGEVFPVSLLRLTFGPKFNEGIDRIVWPSTLEELSFGWSFNQDIKDTVWPNSLRKLTFGRNFNRPICDGALPLNLRELVFGAAFNQAIDRVAWPTTLRKLAFGEHFNKPSKKNAWPPMLRNLVFGRKFDRCIDKVVLPEYLEQLAFGTKFNKPVNKIVWPKTLREVNFGEGFQQPIDDITWPVSLERVAFVLPGGYEIACTREVLLRVQVKDHLCTRCARSDSKESYAAAHS